MARFINGKCICDWCGKRFENGTGYRGNCYCSRRCWEKAHAEDEAKRERLNAEIAESGGCVSWVFKGVLKTLKWCLIGVGVFIAFVIVVAMIG